MTNTALERRRRELAEKAERIERLSAFAAAGEIKGAALLAAEITGELARREVMRSQREGSPHGA